MAAKNISLISLLLWLLKYKCSSYKKINTHLMDLDRLLRENAHYQDLFKILSNSCRMRTWWCITSNNEFMTTGMTLHFKDTSCICISKTRVVFVFQRHEYTSSHYFVELNELLLIVTQRYMTTCLNIINI